MPTYDYHCEACDHTFEAHHSMKDDPLKVCPSCGKPKLKRLIGAGAGIIFKGSGFYETDYKKRKDSPESCCSKDSGKSKNSSCACACSSD